MAETTTNTSSAAEEQGFFTKAGSHMKEHWPWYAAGAATVAAVGIGIYLYTGKGSAGETAKLASKIFK